ncbi:hypothetical protein ACJJTC_017048 [Scirpophaga incertulas]
MDELRALDLESDGVAFWAKGSDFKGRSPDTSYRQESPSGDPAEALISSSHMSRISSTHSETEKYTVDTDDSKYGTMEDYITAFLQVNEEDNFEPLIPFGISDIEYLTEDEKKLKTGTWVLAKFVTKKSEKHFVGKVITIKGTTPEVEFVRKVKESKCNSGVVFTYPRVDDICTIRHLDDILLILPDPNISRRGQIVFNNINLSKYNLQ